MKTETPDVPSLSGNHEESSARYLVFEGVDASIRRSAPLGIPSMFAIGAIYWPWANQAGIVAATLLVTLSFLIYFALVYRFPVKRTSASLRRLTIANALCCAAWGCAPWLMMPESRESQYFLVAIAFAGMVANIADSAALRSLHLAGQLPMVILLTLSFAIGADGPAKWVALMIVITAVYLDSVAKAWSRTALESARLRCRNEHLLVELRETNRILEHRSTHDYLTGLTNRAAFSNFVNSALDGTQQGTPAQLAVLLIDLDGFKAVNDSLGHQAGDQLLIESASRMQSIAPEEALLARLGGDEMAIAWPGAVSQAEVQELAALLNEALREPIPIGNNFVRVSASIGVTRSDSLVTTEEQLLRRADIALYAAKQKGRDRHVLFHSDLLEKEEFLLQEQQVGPSVAELEPLIEQA